MLAPNTLMQNRYLLLRHLTRGGMGNVYLARDEKLGIALAVKETFFSSNDVMRSAFEREVRWLIKLRHPAMPRVIDFFVEGKSMFVVMEYIPGEDLAARLRQNDRPFAVGEVLDWTDQLLSALEYLHNQKPPIIHRDIKPENLKLTPHGEIFLLDFGVARGITEDLSRIQSKIFFTPAYAPLEQVASIGADARADLYSLGATTYHLLTGKLPPDAASRSEAVQAGYSDPLRPAHEVNPKVPPSIATVFHQAMALSPSQRPASAAMMRQYLRNARPRPELAIFERAPVRDSATESAVQGRLRTHFGAWDSGNPNSADNEEIERDLAREHASTHESKT